MYTDMQENMWARLRDSSSGACFVVAQPTSFLVVLCIGYFMPLTTFQAYLNTLHWQTDSPCFVRGVARRQFLRSPSFPVPCILTWPTGQREPEKAEMGRHLESLQHCKRLPDFLSSPKRHMKSNLIPISNLHCRVSDFLTSLYLRFMSFPLSSCVGSVHFPSQYEVKESLTTFRRVWTWLWP